MIPGSSGARGAAGAAAGAEPGVVFWIDHRRRDSIAVVSEEEGEVKAKEGEGADDEEEMSGSWALNARRARKAREAPGRRRTPLDQKFARARAGRAWLHAILA
jgi:hypothetical protein